MVELLPACQFDCLHSMMHVLFRETNYADNTNAYS